MVTNMNWDRVHAYRSALGILATALAVTLAACSSAPKRSTPIEAGDYSYLGQYLDWAIPAEMRRWNVPGVSIAVVDGERVVFEKGYGLADAANRVPATPETLYQTGSVSKLITATEIMRRVDSGELNLDDPITTYLSSFSIRNRFPRVKPITLRTLLAHHSGLPSDRFQGMWESDPESLWELEASLRSESLASPPQTQYRYSNLEYSLLGRVIEEKDGAPFAAVIERDLLRPLGMRRSFFERAARPPVPTAKPHRKGNELAFVGLRDEPAGGLFSSVTDMARFIGFVLAEGRAGDRQLIRADRLQSMFEPQFDGLPLDFGHQMGLGWMLAGLDMPDAGRLSWHDGGYPGYFGALIVARTHKLGVIVLANSEDARKFANQVAMKALGLALEAKRGVPAPPRPERPSFKQVEVPPERLNDYVGRYVIFGTMNRISRNGGRLSVDALGTKLDLIPVAGDRFILKKPVLGLFDIPLPNVSVRFDSVEGRRFAVLEGLPAPFPFERIESKPVPEAWRARLGHYRCENSDAMFEFHKLDLVIEDGVLVARVKVSSRLLDQANAEGPTALEAISDDEVVVVGAGNSEGGVIRATRRNGTDILSYSGYSFTRVGDISDGTGSSQSR